MVTPHDTWQWQEPGTAWRGIGIYHVTLTVTSRQPVLGSLVIPGSVVVQQAVPCKRFKCVRKIARCGDFLCLYLHMSKKSSNFARKIEMRMKKSAIIVPQGCQRVLLHACCAPCSSAIVEWLQAHGIQPVIYYFNPNIYPEAEYEIRKAESKRHAESLGIEWIAPPDLPIEGRSSWEVAHEAWRKQMLRLFLPPPESNR